MATRLEEILSIVTANSEEAVDDFLVIAHPENHEKGEIQETFEEVIGYDPTSYFDYDTLKVLLENMKNSGELPKDVIEVIESDTDEILKEAYDKYDSDRSIYLQDALNYAIEEKTGFNPGMEDEDDDSDEPDYDYYEEED